MTTRIKFYKILLFILLIGLVGLVGCDGPVSSDQSSEDDSIKSETATFENAKGGKGKKIAGEYIVVFKNDVKDAGNSAAQLSKKAGGKIKHVYSSAIKGFSISLPEQASSRAIEALQNNPNVDYIEQDSEIFGTESQPNATWGLDRTDQRNLPFDGIYNYTATGENVTVYIADSGINYTHVDFGGRATFGFDTFGGNGDDCQGHGTHVAGTVGGSQWGIAKNVDLVSVRVLDCNNQGTLSGVIAGIDWITSNANGPSVVNMSLVGGASSTLDNAVENSSATGITYVIAAGNADADACNYSPARAPSALTIGATTSSDARASFSNYGSCVDLFAPGNSITSAHIGGNTATAVKSGTSMATPHVTGTVALYLQENPSATPSQIESFIISNATQDIVTNSNTENNHLLYSIFDGSPDDDGGSTENTPPSADFSYAADYLNIQFTDGSEDSDGTITSWSWNFGDGSNSASQNPLHSYSQAGSYSVTLTVTDDTGDSDSVEKTITVSEEDTNTPPSADFSSSTDFLNVQFTDGSSDSDGTITSWSWNFGDGSNSASQNPSHTYSQAGSYNVTLTVTDDIGDSDSVTKTINVSEEDVNTPPSADFSYSIDFLNVQFTDGSSNSDGSIVSWSWSFGDGTNSSSQNPSYAYGQAGTYTVSLTVTDDNGDSDTVSKNVTVEEEIVNAAPTANFSFSANDLNVQFSDQSTDPDGSVSNWSWNFGDGTSSSSQNPSHNYNQEGTFTVTLTVTDNDGDSDSVSKTVTVSEPVVGINLSANGYKNRGRGTADLSWSGAASSKVDIYRNGSKVKTVNNSGSYTDATNSKGSGSLTYKVCEAGTSICSSNVTVNF